MAGAVQNELRWFALRTIPQRENMVMKLLIWRGLKAFVKTERRAVRLTKWDTKRKPREYCAASGYVFIGLDARNPNPWALTRDCHLIRSVVTICGRPALLDPVKLAEFLGFDDFDMPDYFMYFKTRGETFEIGEQVRIDMPSMEGFTLPVKDIQNGEAIFELVMFANHATTLRVPLEQCYKAA